MQQAVFPEFIDRQALLAEVRNLYCRLRFCRSWQTARRRKLYRDIAKRKALLLSAGLDPEWLRLYCRQFASMERGAMARFEAYDKKF